MQLKSNTEKILFAGLILMMVFPIVSATGENLSIEVTSNVYLLDDQLEGVHGLPFDYPRNFLHEGEAIVFGAMMFSADGIDSNDAAYVTLNDGLVANCHNEGYLNADPNGHLCAEDDYFCGTHTPLDSNHKYLICEFKAGTPDSMHGLEEVEIVATDGSETTAPQFVGEWFFNPAVILNPSSDIYFGEVYPGTIVYSQPIIITNNAEAGVPLNVYISGTDFYDASGSGASCPDSIQLTLDHLSYYAEKSNYSTRDDPRADENGFVPIDYGIGFNNPDDFVNGFEVIQNENSSFLPHAQNPENMLRTDENLTLIFRFNSPLPCSGHFDTGAIYVWGSSEIGEGISTGTGMGFDFIAQSVPPRVTLASEVTYLDENGDVFEPFSMEFPGRDGTIYLVKYLYEGQRILFDVDVFDPNGIQKVADVYISEGTHLGPGNDLIGNCGITNMRNDTSERFHCDYEVESPNYIYGQQHIGGEAIDLDGNLGYAWLGLYDFNSDSACYVNTDCDDGNRFTQDVCVDPATHQAYCQNTPRLPVALSKNNPNRIFDLF